MRQALTAGIVTEFLRSWPFILALCVCGIAAVWWLRAAAQASAVVPESQGSPLEVGGPWSLDDVAKHNQEHDVWIIVKDADDAVNKVYNVTGYVDFHPGGQAILKHAGGNATEGFFGPQHPPTTVDLLREYYIGDLKE